MWLIFEDFESAQIPVLSSFWKKTRELRDILVLIAWLGLAVLSFAFCKQFPGPALGKKKEEAGPLKLRT